MSVDVFAGVNAGTGAVSLGYFGHTGVEVNLLLSYGYYQCAGCSRQVDTLCGMPK